MNQNTAIARVGQHVSQAARAALLAIQMQIAALRRMYAAARAARTLVAA